MNEQELNQAAEGAVRAQEPQLKDVQVRTVVQDFLGGALVFVGAKDGRSRAERLVFCADDGPRVFANCETMARALSGPRAAREPADPVSTAVTGNIKLLGKLGDHLRRLEDWKLLMGMAILALFGGLIAMIAIGATAAANQSQEPIVQIIATTFAICVGTTLGVVALCAMYFGYFQFCKEYHRVYAAAKKEVEGLLALEEELAERLHFLSLTVVHLEKKTRDEIDRFHKSVERRGNGGLDLGNLLVYIERTFALDMPERGGLISRWDFEEGSDIQEYLQQLSKILRRIPVRSATRPAATASRG
jgi:hypothetical protein